MSNQVPGPNRAFCPWKNGIQAIQVIAPDVVHAIEITRRDICDIGTMKIMVLERKQLPFNTKITAQVKNYWCI